MWAGKTVWVHLEEDHGMSQRWLALADHDRAEKRHQELHEQGDFTHGHAEDEDHAPGAGPR